MTESRSTLPAVVRRGKILEIIVQHGFARVSELSARFGTSEVTIRCDLDALSDAGVIQRVHGGAITSPAAGAGQAGSVSQRGLERPFELSALAATDEKARIGATAAGFIRSGQAIMLDVGTTTTAIARAMLARKDLDDVVVITNALNIALSLEPAIPRFTVVVTGGTLRPLQHSLVDPLAGAVLSQIRADIAFIGCSGVDPVAGVTNVNLPEADLKRRMISAAARSVVVADSSKLGIAQLSRVVPISEIDTLVTGAEGDEHQLQLLRAVGLTVVIADRDDACGGAETLSRRSLG